MNKDIILPDLFFNELPFDHFNHNCVKMKTDTLFSHTHDHENNCFISDGIIYDNFYIYDNLKKNKYILTLGGSTTSSFYKQYSNGFTWPYYIYEKIKDKNYGVINGGVGGYSSLQELYIVLTKSHRIPNLKIIISLNGINDIPNYQGLEHMRENFYPFKTDIQYNMDLKNQWIDQKVNIFNRLLPNTTSLLKFLFQKYLINESSNQFEFNRPSFLKTMSASERWLFNVRQMKNISESNGIDYFVFIQPTLGLNGLQSKPNINTNDYIIYKEGIEKADKNYIETLNLFYEDIISHCSILDYCFDISNTALPLGNNYSNFRHHNSNGNRVIANEILSKIYIE